MKNIIVAVLLVLVAGLMSCGAEGEKYADIKKVLTDQTALMHSFTTGLDMAETAIDAAREIFTLTESLKPLAARLVELEKKYPEVSLETDPPLELEKEMAAMELASAELTKVFQKKGELMAEDEVVAAFMEMSNVLSELGF